MSAVADVSVIIPFHNRDQYIDEAIQSVLAQTVKPREIIVVNDASKEASRQRLDHWAGVCQIIDLKKNIGPAAARNEGIRHAKGEFIAFLDDDDLWLPQRLEVQLRYMQQHPDCALVSSNVWGFYADQPDDVSDYIGQCPVTLPQALTVGYQIVLPSWLVRAKVAQALGGFDASFRAAEDQDFVIRCCAAGYRIDGVREPLIRVRRQGHQSVTQRNWFLFRTDLQLCWKHRALYHRVFGIRGIVSFLLNRLHFATRKTRYLDGRVRFLLRVVKVKYEVRANYQEPVGKSL